MHRLLESYVGHKHSQDNNVNGSTPDADAQHHSGVMLATLFNTNTREDLLAEPGPAVTALILYCVAYSAPVHSSTAYL
jgi:hypothetical protein